MSSFEKAGVLFITGLVAVILALALFGTSGAGPSSGSGESAASDAAGRADASKESEAAEVAASPASPAEDDLWTEPARRVNEIYGSSARGSAEPAPVGPLAAPTPGSVREHVVRGGDRLASLAKEYLGDAALWRTIAGANPGIDPNRLRIGQKLVIPAATEKSSPLAAADSRPSAPAEKKGTYVVKKGDTLTSIAARELRDRSAWRKLYEVNKHLVKNANSLPIGVTLALP